jgi:DNA-binding FadR family transcriptional regulator
MPRSPQAKRFAEVMHAIVHDIVTQRLEPGKRLSTEAELMRKYRISRAPLREALRLLETQGLITIRSGPGGGASVARPQSESFSCTVALYLHFLGTTQDELVDAWVSISTLCRGQTQNRVSSFILRTLDSMVATSCPGEQAACDRSDPAASVGAITDRRE